MCTIRVTSSEKVDKGQRYHTDFHLVSIPYPGENILYKSPCVMCTYPLGCEFFKEYRENDHLAEGLHYDWSQVKQLLFFFIYLLLPKQPMVDADFNLPSGLCYRELNVTWDNYQVDDFTKLHVLLTMVTI